MTAQRWLLLGVLLTPRAWAADIDASQGGAEATPPGDPKSQREVEAEDRRQRALRFYDTGNYGAARDEFERANQLLPSFRLLYNLGVVSMALGDSAAAYDYFQNYLSDGGSAVSDDVRAQIRGQLRDLSEHIATLLVQVDVANAEIFIDETRLGLSPLAAVHVNAGFRRISARLSKSQAEHFRSLEVHGGESVSITLTLLPPTKKVAPATKPVFWTGWAGTLVLAAGATFAGIEALSAQHAYQREYDGTASRGELDRLDRRTTAWSVTADTLGAATIAAGAYSLYVTLRSPRTKAATLTGTGLAVQLGPNQARLAICF